MKRTTIMLPTQLKANAEREALRRGISLGEFIRNSMEVELSPKKTGEGRRFFPDDFTFTDNGPPNLAANLDKYLDQIDDEDYQRIQSHSPRAKPKAGRKRRAG